MAPKGLFFTENHEWIKLEGDTATVGVTDHAQESLGEITFVELPIEGKELSAGDEAAVVESSKAASDVYSPAGGTVTEVNNALEDNPETINESCYEDGWIWKMTVKDKSEVEGLIDEQAYNKYVEGLE